MRWLVQRSLRRDFTIIVLVIVVLPLAVTGVWLARSTARAGTDLLRARLDATLLRAADDISARWARTRGQILDIAERAETVENGMSQSLLPEGVRTVVVVDRAGSPRWRLTAVDSSSARAAATFPIELPLHDRSGTAIGAVRAELDAAALVGSATGTGVALGVIAQENGVTLVAPPFDPELARSDRFTLGGQPWLAERRALAEPALTLVAAAPLADFAAPFGAAARRGVVVLGMVVALALVAAAIVTQRTTRSLERLARAADAIAQGDLGRTVDVESGEAGRLAAALNAMSASLRETMRELSRRESLAAVGEFATSLSHEIRNPLASIRLDLQRVQEKLDATSPLRSPLARALGEVDRLNHTVSGALRVARSGRVSLERIDLLIPLGAAIAAATPELECHGATLSVDLPSSPAIYVDGNGPALEQLFLNLLLNAAQATTGDGRVTVSVQSDGVTVEARITDTGVGIAPDQLPHVFEPFFTTRGEGTGVGLAVVRAIAAAHRGDVTLESVVGSGTVARVRMPAARNEPARVT